LGKFFNARSSIEHRILGVDMEMNETLTHGRRDYSPALT